jgi:hypothetical protein
MESGEGKKQRGQSSRRPIYQLCPQPVDQSNSKYSEHDRRETYCELAFAYEEIPEVEKPVMERRVLIGGGSRGNGNKVLPCQPYAPPLIPPHIIVATSRYFQPGWGPSREEFYIFWI